MRYWIFPIGVAGLLLAFTHDRQADGGDPLVKAVNLDKLNTELNAVLNDPEVREKLNGMGITATPGSADKFGEEMKRDLARYEEGKFKPGAGRGHVGGNRDLEAKDEE